MGKNIVELHGVRKSYRMGEVTIHAVDGVEFEIEKGDFAVVVGPSGAGKTTVLNILGGMDSCDEGQVLVDGEDIAGYRGTRLTAYRRNEIGFASSVLQPGSKSDCPGKRGTGDSDL